MESPDPAGRQSTTTESITTTSPRKVLRPVMLQGWHNLASLHWPVAPSAVQRLLPPGLRVDTFDGKAWVGLIPFQMRRVRVPGLPSMGAWSTFPETNVRSYVIAADGRRAVWFHSLDISRIVPTLVARLTYGLPYCWAKMSIEETSSQRDGRIIEYTTRRRWPRRGQASRVAIEVGERIDEPDLSPLERFVTARWALASTFLGQDLWADVHHVTWPMHRARVLHNDDSLITAAGLPATLGEPLALWSPGVEVRIGRPRRQDAAAG